ncbi:hypothetical protein SV7mr_01390 [Stieleria bergensis]|uniref:Uncharacterized protein n=1 Tax=Stieleria bergensis TaxID=2528025 RepID=A0A517SNG4_9BACT|nr:MAG: hypothetical protein CBB71_22555 [Rhodopirellula sp. TMED11]QDT57656.1 hypothetical protein SV7mr_01390 [Planctomycetes bacterium SV_7m_r]
MTTATLEIKEVETQSLTQHEAVVNIQLSDAEIQRRVDSIKSTWTAADRRERRIEAGERFHHLMEALFAGAA